MIVDAVGALWEGVVDLLLFRSHKGSKVENIVLGGVVAAAVVATVWWAFDERKQHKKDQALGGWTNKEINVRSSPSEIERWGRQER